MNREILFRGKTKEDVWVYGWYVFSRSRHYILQAYGNAGYDERWETAEWVEVLPETVGQYTGQRDIEGNRIFEGSSVEYEQFDSYSETWSYGANTVTFSCGGFEPLPGTYFRNYKVIELIEKAK